MNILFGTGQLPLRAGGILATARSLDWRGYATRRRPWLLAVSPAPLSPGTGEPGLCCEAPLHPPTGGWGPAAPTSCGGPQIPTGSGCDGASGCSARLAVTSEMPLSAAIPTRDGAALLRVFLLSGTGVGVGLCPHPTELPPRRGFLPAPAP